MRLLLVFTLVVGLLGCQLAVNTDVQPVDNQLAIKVSGRYTITDLSSNSQGVLIPKPDFTASVTVVAIANYKANMTVFVSQNGIRFATFYLGGFELSEGNNETIDFTQGNLNAGSATKTKINIFGLDQNNNLVRFSGVKQL